MLLDDGVAEELTGRLSQVLLGKVEIVLLEVGPPEAVEIRAVVGFDLERLLQVPHRLVEALAAIGEHVTKVVQRRRILRIAAEQAAERLLRVGVPLLLLEDGGQLERDQVVLGKPRLRVLQNLDGLRAAVGLRIDLRERDVRVRFVGVILQGFLDELDALVRFSAVPQRLRLEA